ncbi:MAG: methionyl-tRNA formyltransferase [Minisyncoccia bacterium]
MENNSSVHTSPVFAFFGTSSFSVIVLDELKSSGFLPTLIVTGEDKPKGRKLVLTPPEVKVWAEKIGVKCIQLKTLRKPESEEIIKSYAPNGFDLFIVASYGKIIPQNILDLPKYKTINVHPSLLPKLRGPSPIISAILRENETGVTIMRLDADIDHGPILAQRKVYVEWPPYAEDLEKTLGIEGGKLLAETIPGWIEGKVKEQEQDHSQATFCAKVQKTDGEIDLSEDSKINLLKIRAYHMWPGAYFFSEQNGVKKRIIVKRAHLEKDEFVLDRVLPEGKKEMNYADYLKGIKK